jgi:hypothetical protein
MRKGNSAGMDARGRSVRSKGFAGLPHAVMEHEDYINLPACAKMLLFDLIYQYRGKNNGDLHAAWSILRKRGFKSQATLSKAKKALIKADLIRCTREGVFLNPGRSCSLYALTWKPIDECNGKHDLQPSNLAPRRF